MKTLFIKTTFIVLAVFFYQTEASSSRGFSNKALIWQAGKYFHNYRMEVGVMSMRYMLEDQGFASSDII